MERLFLVFALAPCPMGSHGDHPVHEAMAPIFIYGGDPILHMRATDSCFPIAHISHGEP